jgi:hypothetical protein
VLAAADENEDAGVVAAGGDKTGAPPKTLGFTAPPREPNGEVDDESLAKPEEAKALGDVSFAVDVWNGVSTGALSRTYSG